MEISTFRSDITPPLGHPLCAGWYPPAEGVADRLFINGIVLFPEEQDPIVLAALDWAEISNGEYDLWRERLALAAGTRAERVAIHCIHAHDAPWPDRDAQRILDEAGFPGVIMQWPWADEVIEAAATAISKASERRNSVTGIRTGKARVEGVAGNRRIMGADGKVRGVRWTRCRDASLRAEPEGVIDPYLKTVSFWNGEKKLAALHYYATHPTSYDGTGMVTTDFVGIARERLQQREGVPHLYFTECAGNITTGKYNDGIANNRELFTRRILDAMAESEAHADRHAPGPVDWRVEPVHLPPRDDRDQSEECLLETINDPASSSKSRSRAAIILAYQRRYRAGIPIQLSALHLGEAVICLHTPGELFIEYQLFAQTLRPDACVVVPSYGDCGPGYITLEKSFAEGGYEPTDSFCSGASEAIMRDAIRKLVD